MSKNIKMTALVLVLVLAFVCGFGMGKNKGFNLSYNNNPYGTTAPDDKTDAEPVDVTAAPTEANDAPQESDKPTKPLKAPKGADAVVSAFNKAVNRAKRGEGTLHKTVTLELTPGEIAPSLAKGAAQAALKNAMQPLDKEYQVAPEGKDATAKEILSPMRKAAKLNPDQVLKAKAKAKDGGYVIVIKLKPETAVLKNEKAKQAKAHAACLSLPSPAQLHAFGIKVKTAKLEYPATVIRAEVNNKGNLTSFKATVPFTAKLTGKYFLMNLNAPLTGTMQETVILNY